MIAARTRHRARAERKVAVPHTTLLAALALLLYTSLLGAPSAWGAFPGTNGAIAYATSDGDGESHLASSYISGAPDGTRLTATAVDHDGDSFSPTWAPDGRSLAFASTRSGHSQIYSLQLNLAGQPMHVCGGEVCRLTDDRWNDFSPSWSPEGQQLVFASDRSGSDQIYAMNANGAGVRRLLCDDAQDSQPAWSRSGLIAFQSNRSGSDQIYVMNANGGEVRQLTHQASASTDPSWSPNGGELAYASGAPGHMQIFTIGLTGGSPKQLTSEGSGENELPAWSPDGTEILVSHRDPTANTGYIYAIEASSGRPIAHERLAGFEGSWAPLPRAPSGARPSRGASPAARLTAIARPLSGVVTINPGGTAPAAKPTSLRGPVELPVHATYDTTRGVVKLEVTTGSAAKPIRAWAIVTGGRFVLLQTRPYGTPTLQLLGQPRGCGKRHAASAAGATPDATTTDATATPTTIPAATAAGVHRQPSIRLHTKDRWKAKGHFGRAAARGTRWEVEDTCRGTVYRTSQDDITVTDPRRHRKLLLTAGHSYIVRPSSRRVRGNRR